ncbi:MAG TPA: GGDEF domain-containing protein [Candidatus Micrarchaeia archaeon]|nr:GGDEF domain-containing protein [Candidatus Micrarchaeia archaeon]
MGGGRDATVRPQGIDPAAPAGDPLARVAAVARALTASPRVADVAELAVDAVRALAGADRVLLWARESPDADRVELVGDTARDEGGGVGAGTAGAGAGPGASAAVRQVAGGGRASGLSAPTPVLPPDPSGAASPGSSLIPMVSGGDVVAVLELRGPLAGSDDGRSWDGVAIVAAHAAAAIEAARGRGRADRLGRTDPLTHLPNRGALEHDLGAEWERSRRYGSPLAFLMVDIDHFKRFNDRHGHLVGDEVLGRVAGLLAASVRATDTVYRYGGEEFAVLARDSGLAAGLELGERLRLAVEQGAARGGRARPLTISIGVAAGERAMTAPAALVARADGALYAAKRAGRNRVLAPDDDGEDDGRATVGEPGAAPLALPGFEAARGPEPELF